MNEILINILLKADTAALTLYLFHELIDSNKFLLFDCKSVLERMHNSKAAELLGKHPEVDIVGNIG